MKKTLAILLAFVMLLAFAACGENKQQDNTTDDSYSYDDDSSPSSGKTWIETATESEKQAVIEKTAIDEVLRILNGKVDFEKSETRYKIGKIEMTKKANKGESWYASGTVYLYNKFGSLEDAATFEMEGIYLSEEGWATRMGHFEINANGQTYNN
ncbi:MAG: hypothetical protein IJT91_05740 [Clostridia bacterium]|nr:hypothetical protein [Clostridia bacterium]